MCLGGGPTMPPVQQATAPPPPPSATASSELQTKLYEQKKKTALGTGQMGSIKTGPAGITALGALGG